MLTVDYNQKFLSLSEILPISKLLLRWPHDSHNAIYKFICRKSLVLYTLESIAKNNSGNFCAILSEMKMASWDYDSLTNTYSNIVVLEQHVENIENEYKYVSYVPASSRDDVIITCEKNLGIVAENFIHMLSTFKMMFDLSSSNGFDSYCDEHEIINATNGYIFRNPGSPIPDDKLYPQFFSKDTVAAKKSSIEEIEMYIKELRSLGQDNPFALTQSVDQAFAKIGDAMMGRLISTDGKQNTNTLRGRGRKWRHKI